MNQFNSFDDVKSRRVEYLVKTVETETDSLVTVRIFICSYNIMIN